MGDSNREPKPTLFSKTPNTEYCMSRHEAKPKSFETLAPAKPRPRSSLRHRPDREIAEGQPLGSLHVFECFIEFDQFTSSEFEYMLLMLVFCSHLVVEVWRARLLDVTPDRDYAHINSLSEVYEGRPYAYSTPEDVPRYRVAITVDKLRTTDIATA